MHLSKLLNIHTYTHHVTWKPIQEKTVRCSSSGIGMRKQMHLLSIHKAIDFVQDLIFYLYILILCLMLFDLLYIYHSTLLLLNDLHTAQIDSTFSICLCTQLQNHYSDALNDLDSLTKTIYLQSSSSIFSKSLETYSKLLYQLISSKSSIQELSNGITHLQLGFLLLQPCYRLNITPIHAYYRLNTELIQTLTDSTSFALPADLLSSANRLSFLFQQYMTKKALLA